MAKTRITFSKHKLKFRRAFGISKLTRTHQDVVRVSLEREGIVGRGETPAISYYGWTADGFLEELEKVKGELEMASWSTPQEFYGLLRNCLPKNSFLRAALDGAAWDWYGLRCGKPVWELLKVSDPAKAGVSNYTIGLAEPEEMVKHIEEMAWPIYKLKLGGKKDEECLRAINCITKNPLRIDANGAWSPEQTSAFVDACINIAPGQVELIEEPFKQVESAVVKEVARKSSIPFYADESFQNQNDLEPLREIFQGMNIKLDKCGGLTPAIELIKQAKSLDYKIQLGCMSSSGIALASAIQLSAEVDVVDLDAVMLIEGEDFGVRYAEGVARVSGGAGLGLI